MQEVTQIKEAFATLKADVTKFTTDATAKLADLAAKQTDPADAATLQDVITGMKALDSSVTAADAALNPPA